MNNITEYLKKEYLAELSVMELREWTERLLTIRTHDEELKLAVNSVANELRIELEKRMKAGEYRTDEFIC